LRPGDEQEDQAVPGFANALVCRILHTQENAKWSFSWLGLRVPQPQAF
jgi:hypothetical protein